MPHTVFLLHRLNQLDILPEHFIDQLGHFHALLFCLSLKIALHLIIQVDRQIQAGAFAENHILVSCAGLVLCLFVFIGTPGGAAGNILADIGNAGTQLQHGAPARRR